MKHVVRMPAYLFVAAAMGAAPGAEDEPAHVLAKVDAQRVAQAEAALRAELDALAAGRIGPIVLTEERFTKKLADGSVQVSQYWGRAPMQAYPFFDAYELLGDQQYLRVALDLADYYLRVQEPEGFWHYAHIVKADGAARRLELKEANGKAVCRIQDTHQTGCFRLMLYAWRVTGDAKYLAAAKRCGDYLLSIQNENGSWPDWWIPGHKHTDPNPRPKAGVIGGGSYNDGATAGGLEMMLVMYHLTRDPKYVARVPRLGQWIFDTQLGQGKVRGWCQQYDLNTNDPTRPAFHFRPPSQWMNDVCGAFHYKGWHHIFYQYNPQADTWGKGIGWGHARSRDLVHWEHLPPALLPDRENGSVLDASGSAAFDDKGRPVLFFAKTPAQGPREQWAALPEDDDLLRWRRVDIGLRPGQSGVPADIKPSWADMFVFAAGGRTLATFKSSGGLVCAAQTPDLLNWKAVGKVDGIGGECPNLFPLQDRHVLILSTEPISYRVGEFDAARIAFRPAFDGPRVLDYGPGPEWGKWNRGLYGTTVFLDAQGRPILLGWISGFKSGRGWNGCMSLPRVLRLDGDELIQTPLPELAELRGEQTTRADSLEIIAEFKPGTTGRYGLKLGSIPIVCNGDKLNVAGTEVPGVRATKLHVFFDRSVIEVFINNGRRTVTKVVYSETDNRQLEAFADPGGGEVQSLHAWKLKPIW